MAFLGVLLKGLVVLATCQCKHQSFRPRMLLLSFVQNLTGRPVLMEFDPMHCFLIGIVEAPRESICAADLTWQAPCIQKNFLDANLSVCVFLCPRVFVHKHRH